MKKSFTLVAAAVCALAANAQQVEVWTTAESLEALGLSSDASEITEGTVLASAACGTFGVAFTDNGKIMDISSNSVKSVIVNETEYALTKGTTGSANPQGIGIATPPTGGWVYRIDVVEDGYVTLFSKFSSNKAYYAFEGTAETEGALIGYDFGMVVDLGDGEQVYEYTLPGDSEFGYFSMDLPDADKYSDGTSMRWPEKIFLGADAADVKKNGFGFISFPVYKDAGTYLFCAQGSKANSNGFIFTAEKPERIIAVVPEKTDAETGTVTPGKQYVFRGTTGISSVTVDNVETPMYNVLGQPVDNNYKGLVIKNGRKFINR